MATSRGMPGNGGSSGTSAGSPMIHPIAATVPIATAPMDAERASVSRVSGASWNIPPFQTSMSAAWEIGPPLACSATVKSRIDDNDDARCGMIWRNLLTFNILGYCGAINIRGCDFLDAARSVTLGAHPSGLPMADTGEEIFYVDDSADDRFFAEYSASRCAPPIQLKTYATGFAAILEMERRIARHDSLPALLIADHYMPMMDGPELLQQIRGRKGLQSVRLVICSGGDDPVDVETALAAGAAAMLPKPVDFEVCRKMIGERPPSAA